MSGWIDPIWRMLLGFLPFELNFRPGPEERRRQREEREEEKSRMDFAQGRMQQQLKEYERTRSWKKKGR